MLVLEKAEGLDGPVEVGEERVDQVELMRREGGLSIRSNVQNRTVTCSSSVAMNDPRFDQHREATSGGMRVWSSFAFWLEANSYFELKCPIQQ